VDLKYIKKGENMNCAICGAEDAHDTEFGILCNDCYDVELAARMDLKDML
jgi:hypothetical protein